MVEQVLRKRRREGLGGNFREQGLPLCVRSNRESNHQRGVKNRYSQPIRFYHLKTLGCSLCEELYCYMSFFHDGATYNNSWADRLYEMPMPFLDNLKSNCD